MTRRRTALGLLLAGAASAAIGQGRLRPPDATACPRDHLTSYDGRPLRYSRQTGRTRVTIRTDADTTETVLLRHPGSDDPSASFLLAGQPFQPGDWSRIEKSPGKLLPGLRVVAWVCDDGRPPVLDWQPPPR